MRISFILSSLWLSGGVMLVIEYANRLAARGHDVAVVAPGNTIDANLLNELDGSVTLHTSAAPLPSRRTPLSLLRLAFSLTHAIPRSDVVVATHTPTVVPALLAAALSRAHHRIWLYMDYDAMFADRRVERWLLHHAPNWFEHILTISQPATDQLRPRTRTPITMTGSGLRRPDIFRPPERLQDLETTGAHVLYVGDNRRRKGFDDVLAATEHLVSTVPNLHLTIASKETFEVDTSVPYSFHLLPSDEELADLYRRCDVFVSASWGEGLGYPPLEAMACGAPVVVTDSGGVRDYAQHEENCLLVPARNPDALAAALERVLTTPDLARRLAHNGPTTAQQYDWERAVDRMEGVLTCLA